MSDTNPTISVITNGGETVYRSDTMAETEAGRHVLMGMVTGLELAAAILEELITSYSTPAARASLGLGQQRIFERATQIGADLSGTWGWSPGGVE